MNKNNEFPGTALETMKVNSGTAPTQLRRFNSAAWKAELERASPLLDKAMEEIAKKGNIQSEWKTGLVEMQRRLEQFSNDLPETKSKVLMIKNETKDFLYKVEAKESYLSEKFGDLIVEYRKAKEEKDIEDSKCNEMKAKVESLTNQLTVMERKMNDVRRDLESQGNSMTDNSPIIKMKEATQQLKVEVKQLDVRIGLLDYALISAHMRNRERQSKNLRDDDDYYDSD